MYTVISLHHGIRPQCLYCLVMWVGFLPRSVKILKHSARFSLQVIDGLKVISLFSCLALAFLSFCVLVRDIPSGGSCFIGLCFGGMSDSLVSIEDGVHNIMYSKNPKTKFPQSHP